MDLLFWICAILLALGAVGGYALPPPQRTWVPGVSGVLVVIDLVILGARVIGLPH